MNFISSKWMDTLIEHLISDFDNARKILLDWTPGYYAEGDNYRFFVPFEKQVRDEI